MGEDPASTELIADRGAAAESPDFFRSRPFLAAEGVTHSLRIAAGGWTVAMPVIVREIPDEDLCDAISPYGYPGARVVPGGAEPPDPGALDWRPTGLVSLFARERIGGPPCLAGARRRADVQVHDPSLPRDVRSRLAEQIRHNQRLGYTVEALPGPGASDEARRAFHSLYTQTMERTGAGERYFFSLDYLSAALTFERSWLLLGRGPEGGVAAGAIAALSDGVLHYFLGGTADEALDESPFKNVVAGMLDLAEELNTPLSLGGGLTPGDGLEGFKRGFANTTLPFFTHEVVSDADAYARLSAGRATGEFFPAYRAPA